MSASQLWTDLQLIASQLKSSVYGALPKIAAAILLLLIGLVLARLCRGLVRKIAGNFERAIPNEAIRARVHGFMSENKIPVLLGRVAFWGILLIFFTLATETLQFPVITTWFSGLLGYLPRVIAAVAIVVIGHLGGVLLKDVIVEGTGLSKTVIAPHAGKLVHGMVVFISVLIAINQVGIEVTLLSTLLTIAVASLLLSAAISFGLGARQSVSNILASNNLRKVLGVGQVVKVGDITGRVIRITANAVVVDTESGRAHVPGHVFDESIAILIGESDSES